MPGNISDVVPKADVENAIRWDFALWEKKQPNKQPGERVEGKAVLKSAEAEGVIRKSGLQLAWK